MNLTPSGERTHIAFFGNRNAGKSSIINALLGQNLSIVSSEKGTTTDPVKKTMELLPLGPVVIIDTAGVDDEGKLGLLRVEKTYEVLNITDIAVVVVDSVTNEIPEELIKKIKEKNIPYILCFNKADLKAPFISAENEIAVSTVTKEGIEELKNMLSTLKKEKTTPLVADLISQGDTVVLVTPIDESAPKGRIILPQQMVLRDILDSHAIAVTVQPSQLETALSSLKTPPRLVICDSQAFKVVSEIVPESIPLTSFSILMLRYKLGIEIAKTSAGALDNLKDGDTLLIAEGCTHHRQCGDIGTVKLPAMIKKYTGKNLNFSFTSGGEFPKDLSPYAMVIHCGGCMLGDKAVKERMNLAVNSGVPFSNYGIIISKTQGILDRSLEIFNS